MEGIAQFKEALSRYPSGVVIVTTRSRDGVARGFTASSFTSVSANPPLILACIDERAECYEAFTQAKHFSVSLLRPHHQELAELFARRGADKFSTNAFDEGPHSQLLLKDALANLVCEKRHDYPCGDHVIIIGEVVQSLVANSGEGMVHYQRKFWSVGHDPAFSPA